MFSQLWIFSTNEKGDQNAVTNRTQVNCMVNVSICSAKNNNGKYQFVIGVVYVYGSCEEAMSIPNVMSASSRAYCWNHSQQDMFCTITRSVQSTPHLGQGQPERHCHIRRKGRELRSPQGYQQSPRRLLSSSHPLIPSPHLSSLD